MSTFSAEIKRLRTEKGWSQAQLAVYSETSQPTVNQIETGKRNPSADTLVKLARALGVEVVDLFPKVQSPLPETEDKRREPKLPETAVHDLYRWTQDKTTEELQQIALEEARFAKAPTREEWLAEREDDRKAWLEKGHRRVMAYATIANINEELDRRGVRSPVELAIKQFNDAMSVPGEAPQESRENQEGQRAG